MYAAGAWMHRSGDLQDVMVEKLLENLFPTFSPTYVPIGVLHFRHLPAGRR